MYKSGDVNIGKAPVVPLAAKSDVTTATKVPSFNFNTPGSGALVLMTGLTYKSPISKVITNANDSSLKDNVLKCNRK